MENYEYPAWYELYDLLYKDYELDNEYYCGLANETNGRILEIGCGTGRLTIPIASLGKDITGLDVAPLMLQRLRIKAAERNLVIKLIEGDMEKTSLEGPYDLIIIPFRAFLHVHERNRQLSMLCKIRKALTPRGRLCFNILMPDFELMVRTNQVSYLKKRIETHTGHVLWLSVSEYDLLSQEVVTNNVIQQFDSEGRYLTTNYLPQHLRWLTVSEIQAFLNIAGFSKTTLYGDFCRSPISKNSKEILIEATI